MTERSRRSFLRTAAVGGALTSGAVLLPSGLARAATATPTAPLQPVPQPRSTTYSLRVTNNSSSFEQFAVYQNDPDLGVYNVMSLAWFVKGAAPGQTMLFEWSTDYSFMLFGNGGSTVTQSVAADPSDINQNQIQLTYAAGAYAFKPGQALGTSTTGNLYINELSTIPPGGKGRVGIGMSGAPLYATQAEPNVQLMFTPHPSQNFWITAGKYEPGVVLDVEQISTAAELVFAPGVFALEATLGLQNTWNVSPVTA